MRLPIRFIALVGITLLTAAPALANLTERAEIAGFIDQMVQEHQFERSELNQLFADVSLRDDIIQAISRPAEARPWHQYRPIFMTERRIREGAAFYREHRELLERAEAVYGVDPFIITAILGVETHYGLHRGRYRVIDALSTLAFDYPPRANFFRRELVEFLLMSREEARDPREFKGSYAGAMGQPQFIASSFRAYAVDFDGNGRRDLWDNIEDIVGSVANYFARHRWQPGAPVAHPATVSGDRYEAAVAQGYRPRLKASDLAGYGVSTTARLDPETPVAVIQLETAQGPEFWVVRDNFYVITRYNHSALYAMAVWQLAQAIEAQAR